MRYQIKPSSIMGTIEVPPSKSHTLRAILFGLMGEGTTRIHNALPSPDAEAMIRAAQQLGAQVKRHEIELIIEGIDGQIETAEDVIDAGNSGQVLRFVGALAALSSNYTVITGDHSIRHNRPVKPLLDALNGLGVMAESMRGDGYAPIIIKGPYSGGKTQLDGADSQPVSGLLIAGAFADHPTEIHVTNPGEKPWIDVTLHWLEFLGLKCTHRNYEHYTLPGKGHYRGFNYHVPGDFSSAAYPIAAALITNSEVELLNIDMSDVQGDKKLIEALISLGAQIEINKRSLIVKRSPPLQGGKLDINDYIDAITILAVLGCFCSEPLEIIGASIARKKECDRISSIAKELGKMGAQIEERPDGLLVYPSSLRGTTLQTYRDHRMVLSLSVAALGAEGLSTIEDVEVVNKTYPTFASHFQRLGAQLEVIP